jgi:DNA polymerase III epsilon subunit-like protein
MIAYPLQLGDHQLAAVDIETTGLIAGYHEIIQIAIVLCDDSLNPLDKTFVYKIRPEHKERVDPKAMECNRLDLDELIATAPPQWVVAERLSEFVKSLNLPVNRNLVPLAHNWAFESAFMNAWLGLDHFQQIWYRRARDSMTYAASICDREERAGRKRPFEQFSLEWLTKHFNVVNLRPHDAEFDTRATIELYAKLLDWDAAQQNIVNVSLPYTFPPVTVPAEPVQVSQWQPSYPATPYPYWPSPPVFYCSAN